MNIKSSNLVTVKHRITVEERWKENKHKGGILWFTGLPGSGKSTLLRIMAGVDTDIEGEATPLKGLKIGY